MCYNIHILYFIIYSSMSYPILKIVGPVLTIMVFFVLIGNTTYAVIGQPVPDVTNNPANTNPGTPATLSDPLNLPKDSGVQVLIGRVINAALGVVGSLALLMFVYGGLLWMASGGNDEKVKQGREILIWATAGLALVFFSYVLVRFVIQGLTGQALPGATQQEASNDAAQRGFNYQTGQ